MTAPSVVRAWARTAGIPVPAVGRLSDKVLDAYRAAHPDDTGAES